MDEARRWWWWRADDGMRPGVDGMLLSDVLQLLTAVEREIRRKQCELFYTRERRERQEKKGGASIKEGHLLMTISVTRSLQWRRAQSLGRRRVLRRGSVGQGERACATLFPSRNLQPALITFSRLILN